MYCFISIRISTVMNIYRGARLVESKTFDKYVGTICKVVECNNVNYFIF